MPKTLVYHGTVKECGFTGKSQRRYVVHPGEPFDVLNEDAGELLRQYPDHLTEVVSSRKAKPIGGTDHGTEPDDHTTES